jgi:hypothetical protein
MTAAAGPTAVDGEAIRARFVAMTVVIWSRGGEALSQAALASFGAVLGAGTATP